MAERSALSAAGDTHTTLLASGTRNGTVGVQVTGTFVGTLVNEVTIDGSNWVAISSRDPSNETTVANMTAPGIVIVESTSYRGFRTRMSAYTSGVANITHYWNPG